MPFANLRVDMFVLADETVGVFDKVNRSGDGSLICYYSLNNPVTDARYSGQLSESCSLVA